MKRLFVFLLTLIIYCILSGCGHENNGPGPNGSGRITITDNQFTVDGKRIWINGANTPWDQWNDFGGAYNNSWWDAEFAKLKAAGINATRIWINCNGWGHININADGTVTGATDKHWQDLDSLFAIAEKHQLYIMATLLSFDHFKIEDNRYGDRWRALITENKGESFAQNYTIPFVERYKDNIFLWSIDVMNEPDWVHEESGLDWNDISRFLGIQLAVIREHSDILSTVGIAYAKWNGGNNGSQNQTSASGNAQGNKISDSYLLSLTDNPNARVDFYSVHYYDWVGQWYGTPFYQTPDQHLNMNASNRKLSLIGECAAIGNPHWTSTGNNGQSVDKTILDNLQNAYNNGWQGVMPWTSNGVDGAGSLEDFRAAALYMREQYPDLIFP